MYDYVGTRGRLPWRVAGCAVAGTGRGGRESVPEVQFFLLDAGLAGFVGLDVVGEEVAPVVVRHVGYVALGVGGDAGFADGAYVVGFTVVIPGKNLLCQFPDSVEGGLKRWYGMACLLTSTNWGCIWRTCCHRLCHRSSPRQVQFLPYWGSLV